MTHISKELRALGTRQGNKIHYQHGREKYTQNELAAKIGVEPDYLSKIVRGVIRCTLSILEKIIEALSLSKVVADRLWEAWRRDFD